MPTVRVTNNAYREGLRFGGTCEAQPNRESERMNVAEPWPLRTELRGHSSRAEPDPSVAAPSGDRATERNQHGR